VESTILVFSFYWAPWFSRLSSPSDPTSEADANVSLDPLSQSAGPLSRYLDEMNITVTPSEALGVASPGPVSALPLILIYSSLMTMAMIGHYLHTLALPAYGNDRIFQILLLVAGVGYLIAAVLTSLSSSSPSTIYFLALTLQLCSGTYWPCIGFLRGKYILPEIRGVVITFTRLILLLSLALT
jgi:hypothetical protein